MFMIRKLLLVLPLAILLLIPSCRNGEESIPGLSAAIFGSLKDGNQKKFEKTFPSAEEVRVFYKQYYGGEYESEAAREEAAMSRAGTIRLNLIQNYKTVRSIAAENGIPLGTSTMSNFRFVEGQHEDGYPEAQVHLDISAGSSVYNLKYTAIKIENQWYLLENLKWE
jgi:hypothetical protein